MKSTETLLGFLKNRLSRCVFAVIGLLIFSVGSYFQIQANYGMSPWSSLNLGLAMNFPITYGTASIIVSIVIILVDILMREPIGLGTILNAVVIGVGSDICIALNFYPVQTELIGQTFALLLGIVVTCVGQFIYMKAGLSCGPRDSLLVGLGKRFRKVSIGTVNIVLLAVVFVCCLFLGSPVGLGTVISVFGTGMIMDVVFKILKFDPKAVVHEDLPGTVAAMMKVIRK